jgi:hypothetical protein
MAPFQVAANPYVGQNSRKVLACHAEREHLGTMTIAQSPFDLGSGRIRTRCSTVTDFFGLTGARVRQRSVLRACAESR